tara:strand:+ start:1546 stop:2796 length:1251 start_codon:yes stop_codon:yes gene_type:complete
MITVIGLGFVGLTSALGFAENGHKVFGFEKDKEKNEMLKNDQISFHEPYLLEKLKYHKNNRNFVLSENLRESIIRSEVILICVGTPSSETGRVDLSQIKNVIKDISDIYFESFKVICIKSTVPPSTINSEIIPYLNQLKKDFKNNLSIVHNPEFLREGYAWKDFINPDRIVIGSDDEQSKLIMNKIYKNFNAPIFNVNITTSEFVKYASNTLLASLISFSNELEMIAYSIGNIDIKKSFEILHKDSRWSGHPSLMSSYVYPGCGFGGYCLPKDIRAMIYKSQENNHDPKLLKEIIEINTKIRKFLLKRIINFISLEDKICILGLSFKPNSDDVRDSPSAWIIKDLIDKGFKNIIAYDPIAIDNFQNLYKFKIEYCHDFKKAVNESSIIILATAWEEFKKVKIQKTSQKIFDLRFFL